MHRSIQNRIAILFLILFGFFTLYLFHLSAIRTHGNQPNHARKAQAMRFSALERAPAAQVARSVPAARPASAEAALTSWEEFKKRWGDGLVAEFDSRGVLLSARGLIGGDLQRDPSFDSRSESKVRERAQSIVKSAEKLLGISSQAPLGEPQVRVGEGSAHAIYSEEIQGLPLSPFGTISLDLGPGGELLGLYSDYAGDLEVLNQRALGPEQARQRIQQVLSGTQAAHGGRAIVWSGGGKEARHAYEYHAEGRQIIVDAESGEILSNRDRRHF